MKNHTTSEQLIFCYISTFSSKTPSKYALRKAILTLWFQAKICLLIHLTLWFLVRAYHMEWVCTVCYIWINPKHFSLYSYTKWEGWIGSVFWVSTVFCMCILRVLKHSHVWLDFALKFCMCYRLHFQMQLESKTADHLTLHDLPKDDFLAPQSIFSPPGE